MRPVLGLVLLVGTSACSSEDRETAVVPSSIDVSADRRALTVTTSYPVSLYCGHLPGGLEVEVEDGVALITALMKNAGNGECPSSCESVTQTITLDEPLPTDVRFEVPPDADPGCGGPTPPSPQG